MLLYKFSNINLAKLDISSVKVSLGWKDYLTQYLTAFDCLLGLANKRKYQMNRKFMPFMFIFRHSVELYLKIECQNKGVDVGQLKTHSLAQLGAMAQIPQDFLDNLKELFCDTDGSLFRYLANKNNQSDFGGQEELEVINACCFWVDYCNNNSIYSFKNNLEEDKKSRWELTFHINECDSLGVLRNQYDDALAYLLQCVKDGIVAVGDIYMPLLFLLRHSIELAFKDSLGELGNKLDSKKYGKVVESHSLEKLYNFLKISLDSAISKIPQADPFYKECCDKRQEVEVLTPLIQQLDAKSQSFRFPKPDLSIKKDTLSEIVSMYQKADSYLSWCVQVLFESGYLEIDDDLLDEIMGFDPR